MTASVSREPATPDQTLGLSALVLGAAALVACGFAFVGLSAEGYWTDELFTLYLVNHHGGLAEVWRRALTDTHPPLYYFLLYGWAQIFGQSETALRTLSALLCVGAVAVFVAGTRRIFTLNARLFAAGVAAASPFWFMQSQNLRNYTLCLLVSSILTVLAIRARAEVREGKPVQLLTVAGLALFGAAGAFTHFYLFLAVGLLYLFLIVTVPSLRLRIALLISGAAIFVGELAYMRLLLHATQQDTHAMWFRADAGFFANETLQAAAGLVGPGALTGLIALALVILWPPRRGAARAISPVSDGAWSVWLGISVVAGVIVTGIAISLIFAPSYSNMNVLAASPVLWPALAAAFDTASARARGGWRWVAVGVPALALAAQQASQAERWLPRGEAWRESARFVLGQPGCAGQAIAVVLPARFGPPTAFFRDLAQHDFYGYYFAGQAARLTPYRAQDLVDPAQNPALKIRIAPGACPVLAWAVHDINRTQAQALAGRLAAAAGVPPGAVEVVAFDTYRPVWAYARRIQTAFVFLRRAR